MKTRRQRIAWGKRGAKKRWKNALEFETRFWNNVAISTVKKCWVWKLSKTNRGYGKVKRLGKTLLAHRVAFQFNSKNKLTAGIEVLHKCDNPPCCNPHHLFKGTRKINVRDAVKKGRMEMKLSDKQIQQIRHQYKRGESQTKIAKEFKVNQGHISKIVNFKRRI